MFPVLKEDVSVRDEPNGALFRKRDTYELRSPFEAFLLLLFDGQHSVADVSSILRNMKGSPDSSHVERDVLNFIHANQHILNMNTSASEHIKPCLDPLAFLRKDHPFTRPARCSGPLGVTLYLTRRCNLNCVYCFADARYYKNDKLDSSSRELPTDHIMRIVDQLHAVGVTDVTLTGGEVTLRPDLAEIVRSFMTYGIDVHLATNACLMDEQLARQLWDAGLRKMQVKLDAVTPSMQDRLARKKGSHAKLIKGIKLITSVGFSVSVACVMTSANVGEAVAIAELCEGLGVANVSFRVYEPGIWALRGRGDDHLNVESAAIIKLVKAVDAVRRNCKEFINVEPVSLSQFMKKKEESVPSCPGMISTCTIMENGMVSVCEMLADFSEEFVFGNVNDTKLIDIWNSTKANEWVARKGALQGLCLSCEELNRCKGGCPWKATVAYGNWLCDPHCIKAPQPTKVAFSEVSRFFAA
jgi:radical SAM protein with 4Fe4S-binding SPASM domain